MSAGERGERQQEKWVGKVDDDDDDNERGGGTYRRRPSSSRER